MTHGAAPGEPRDAGRGNGDERRAELDDARQAEGIFLAEDVERREVADERGWNQVGEKAPQPLGVDVDRILRQVRPAVGERVRELAAVDRPEEEAQAATHIDAKSRIPVGTITNSIATRPNVQSMFAPARA